MLQRRVFSTSKAKWITGFHDKTARIQSYSRVTRSLLYRRVNAISVYDTTSASTRQTVFSNFPKTARLKTLKKGI